MKAEMELREKEWRASADWRATAPTHYTSTVYRSGYSPYTNVPRYNDYALSGSPMRYSSPSRLTKSPARI